MVGVECPCAAGWLEPAMKDEVDEEVADEGKRVEELMKIPQPAAPAVPVVSPASQFCRRA